MHRVLCILSIILTLTLGAPKALAQDYSWLLRDFSSSAISRDDKRFLQAALAFEGHYNGLLDGDWGRLSQTAMDRYSRKEYGTPAQDWHMAMLAFSYFERYSKDGWNIEYFDSLGLSLLFPTEAVKKDEPTENFVNWQHTGSSLSYSVGVNDSNRTQKFHDFTVSQHEQEEPPYTVRKTNFAVTTARKRDGSLLYTRSNFLNGAWSTVMLSASRWDEPTLNAVAASISVGRTTPVMFTEDGRLHDAIKKVIAIVESEPKSEKSEGSATVAQPDKSPTGGSGTGFFVSDKGHVLTNAHVVEGCKAVYVDGAPARLQVASEEFDLAILKTAFASEKAVAVFSIGPAKLNSDVTVAGYPLAGVLSGLNVTRGAVSSLKGLAGNSIQMQITAPVQSGNSGGPVIDSDGAIVGVVVSKLGVKWTAESFGDIPQNVNFAIRGEIAKLFLSQNGVDPVLASSDHRLAPEELAERASSFTAFVECQ